MSVAKDNSKSLFRYRFGTAEFDESRFELRVAGLAVEVQRKPLEVLALLLAHAGEVVTKEELLTNVWAGRQAVEAVITNAFTKLRDALGADNAAQIVTQPRVGYRLNGVVERVAVGRAMISRIELSKGDLVPFRPNFQLKSLLSASSNSEVWVACHLKTKEQRVYKFAPDGEHLSTLKREVTLFRLLQESLGAREDLARILDWNFETAPFFIECEYGGESLQAWAEHPATLQSFTLQQRIDLFLQIATVVAAAHDVGVLHKDIKPANVLIAPHSATTWQIRLTDFGSGRVLDPQRLADLGITQLGLTMTTAMDRSDNTGTLLYLAPELMVHQAPTIQSDVYALGVLLYQVLTGDLYAPMAFGWERQIDDELLRDDIRAATEGNPAHRLHSVHALIERLRTLDERHHRLQQEQQAQIIADQARETVRRAEARRPWMMAAGIAGVLFLIGFATSSSLYLHAIHVQRQLIQSQAQTAQQAARAEAINNFWNNDVLGAADPFAGEGTKQQTIKEVMTSAANKVNGKFGDDPITEATIRMTLGKVFNNMADGAAAESQLRLAVTALTHAGNAAVPQLIRGRYGLALAALQQSKFDQAAAELADTDRLRQSRGANDPQIMVIAHLAWGKYFYQQQQMDSAISHFEQALQLLNTQQTTDLPAIDNTRVWLGDAYISANRLEDAENLLRQLIGDLKQRGNQSELMMAVAKGMYGAALLYQHRYQDAEPLIEQSYQSTVAVFGKTHPRAIDSLTLRCDLYSMTKRLEKSLQCVQEAYTATRANNGDHHWSTFSALADVGAAQYALNRYAIAARLLRSASAGLTRLLGTDKYATQLADYYLARSLVQLHQGDHAQLFVQHLDTNVLSTGEPGAPWAQRIQLLRGMILLDQGKRADALSLLQRATQLHNDTDTTDTILQEARQSLLKVSATNSSEHLAAITGEPPEDEMQ